MNERPEQNPFAYQVGVLWIWAESGTRKLMLGNAAARDLAQANTAQMARGPCPGAPREQPGDFQRAGCLRLPGGPVVALDISVEKPLQGLRSLLAQLITQDAPNTALRYARFADGTHSLWQDDRFIATGVHGGEAEGTHGFGLIFEVLLALLDGQDVLTILHGSAVYWRGKRIIFVGLSGAGKSTLAALCVANGGQYLGDDYVALKRDGSIVPIPLAPAIKAGSWPVLTPHFPQLSAADVYYKSEIPLKYLPDAPYALDAEKAPADLLIFPHFAPAAPPKAVMITLEETLLHLSRAGLWMEQENLRDFVDLLRTLRTVVLRHSSDTGATFDLLQRLTDDTTPA